MWLGGISTKRKSGHWLSGGRDVCQGSAETTSQQYGREDTQLKAKLPEAAIGQARDKAAAKVGASPRYVSEVKAIKLAAPELVKLMCNGRMTVSLAKQLEHFPKARVATVAKDCGGGQCTRSPLAGNRRNSTMLRGV